MIDVANEDIFVAIAAYREPELRLTIESCLEQASHPERLHFGICLQHDRSGPAETQPDCLDGIAASIRVNSFDWTESKGGCWARHNAQGLYNGEGYTMQIDSHMRMVDGWDTRLIAMMHDFPSSKPLITGHAPLYDRVDDTDHIPTDVSVPVTVCQRFTEPGWVQHPGVTDRDNTDEPRPTRVLSGMFVFTLGQWNTEVRQDPEHLYTGEELALTIRSFTWGYDLYNPTTVVAWHRHHPDGNRKYVHEGDQNEVGRRDRRAYQRLRHLHRGDPDRILEPYSTGSFRTVAEFHEWSGLHFATRSLSEDARTGVTPPTFESAW